MTDVYEAALNRITQLVYLLSSCEKDSDLFGTTITSICERTGSSPNEVREDLIHLNRYGFFIEPQGPFASLSPEDDSFDDVRFSLDMTLPLAGDYASPYLIFLNRDEQAIMEKSRLGVMVKDSLASASAEVRERLRIIREAIRTGKCIEFTYKSPSLPAAEHVKAAPVMLCHNRTDDLWYCVVFPDAERIFTYRLDRIMPRSTGHDVLLLKESFTPPPREDPRFERLSLMWGMDFDNAHPDPVCIKVRIAPNTSNILNKIRADIADRTEARLYEENGFWYYEDRLIGLRSFKNWLLSFGSSVKVLSPASLAEEIIAEAKKWKAMYEIGSGS